AAGTARDSDMTGLTAEGTGQDCRRAWYAAGPERPAENAAADYNAGIPAGGRKSRTTPRRVKVGGIHEESEPLSGGILAGPRPEPGRVPRAEPGGADAAHP